MSAVLRVADYSADLYIHCPLLARSFRSDISPHHTSLSNLCSIPFPSSPTRQHREECLVQNPSRWYFRKTINLGVSISRHRLCEIDMQSIRVDNKVVRHLELPAGPSFCLDSELGHKPQSVQAAFLSCRATEGRRAVNRCEGYAGGFFPLAGTQRVTGRSLAYWVLDLN